MKIDEKKVIPYLIVAVPITLVLMASFFITTFYIEKMNTYFADTKELYIKEYVESKKSKSEMLVNQLNFLFDYKYNKIDEDVKRRLAYRVNIAYESARFIYEKYKGKKSKKEIKERILDALNKITDNTKNDYIYISDFNGNSVLPRRDLLKSKNSYQDADGRAIILEEIQKVRKHSEGYLYSNLNSGAGKEIIFVKNLSMYNWYIGSRENVTKETKILKSNLLNIANNIPIDRADFVGLYDAKKPIFLSQKMNDFLTDESLKAISSHLSKEPTWHENKLDKYYYYSIYYEPLDWHLVYGFEISDLSIKELEKQKKFEQQLDSQLTFIVKVLAFIVILVVVLSLLLFRKINHIFSQY